MTRLICWLLGHSADTAWLDLCDPPFLVCRYCGLQGAHKPPRTWPIWRKQ